MNLRSIKFPSHSLFHSPPTTLISLHKTSSPVLRVRASAIPPRDRIIDFGKHKGKMLGTLPYNYLKWVSNNLITQDFEHWAKLAEQVLDDPVYRDRIEWEYAHRLMSGDGLITSDLDDVGTEFLDVFERFGWDCEDNEGWRKVDFELLGTSRGGRIPRVSERVEGGEREREKEKEKEKGGGLRKGKEKRVVSEGRQRRRERRERVRSNSVVVSEEQLKKKRLGGEEKSSSSGGDDNDDDDGIKEDRMGEIRSRFPGSQLLSEEGDDNDDVDEIKEVRMSEIRSRFPGRQSLLEKALGRRRK